MSTIDTLRRFDTALRETAPRITSRLQPGLTIADIAAKTDSFSWKLPHDAFDLYQCHNGLSGQPGKLNLAEKLLRLKGKWHGELSGRENEAHLKLGDRLIVAKFLPLDYALAGHRHLKLGRCPIDLLPICILTEGKDTIYCMMRLDSENPILYCAEGTNLPPVKVTESFLSTQPQFNRLSSFIAFLTVCCQQGVQSISSHRESLQDEIDLQLNPVEFERLYQQQTI
jgi:hypothetical protein